MAKIIDRFLLFIFSLTMIGCAGYVLLAAFGVISYVDFGVLLHNLYYDTDTAVSFIVTCSLAVLISLRFLYIAVRPGRVNSPSIDQRTEYGDVRISLETVENLALKAALRTRGIKDLKARVSVNEAGLEIVIRTLIDGEHAIPALTEEIQSTVKAQIEEVTGIPVATVSVFIANVVQAGHVFKSRVE